MNDFKSMTLHELEELVEFGYGSAEGRLEALLDTLVCNGVLSNELIRQVYQTIIAEEGILEDYTAYKEDFEG